MISMATEGLPPAALVTALGSAKVRLQLSAARLDAGAADEDEIRVTQQEMPHLTGGVVWEAARLLEAELRGMDIDWPRARVLELGSGTGWLALQLARRGAAVTATDRRGMLDLLRRNVLRNQKRFPCTEEEARRGRWTALDVEVVELDWEEEGVLAGESAHGSAMTRPLGRIACCLSCGRRMDLAVSVLGGVQH